MPVEGFKGHVATDGSLAGKTGTWEEEEHVVRQWCSLIVVKRWRPLHGMYSSVEAELEVQRTIKRA